MIKILFIRSERAFLPEIDAYIKYFNKFSQFLAFDSSKLENDYSVDDFDVIWEFKGFGGLRRRDKIIIHEYASLSIGTLPTVKNFLKAKINPQPNLRVFLNEDVKNGFNFSDSIDYCTRDMGIDQKFIDVNGKKKEYDFVYVGSVCKKREIDTLLNKFVESSPGKLCLVGDIDIDIYRQYKNNKDITFTGKVSYVDVPNIASKAIYGINFIPDKYPYNLQTSTKLMEYLALGLKVITTDYNWVRQFEHKYKCSFLKLDYNHFNFDLDNIENYDYSSEFDPHNFLWQRIIETSGIKDQILNLVKT